MGKAEKNAQGFSAVALCLLTAVIMAYGWGYRGVVGHEGGAMVPGAMLGMAICLASGRQDWYRRAAVGGLFAAVGWAWGGSLSYMEHPKYTVSDSFPDVLYGYTILFFMGGLWAGIGGGFLGMGLTESRSSLQRFVGPFSAVCTAYFLTFLVFLLKPEWRDAFDIYTARNWNDGDWFAALTALVVSAVYWVLRPRERSATALIFWCSVGWWIGYGGLTKLGGLLIAPPQRSESWGGVLGILVVLIIYLVRRQNRAALLLCRYGMLGGGFAFALAVFIRHPVYVNWAGLGSWGFAPPTWKIAEESFGLFMGLSLGLGAVRLLRGGLKAPEEDISTRPLDIYAVFVILIALVWINIRRAPMAWMFRYHTVDTEPVLGVHPGIWFIIAGAMFSTVGVYALYLYGRDRLALAPSSAYGKAALVFLCLIWFFVIGSFIQTQAESYAPRGLIMNMSFWFAATLASLMVLSWSGRGIAAPAAEGAQTSAADRCWLPGRTYWIGWGLVPLFLLLITAASTAMQDGPQGFYRQRFGPDAYHTKVERMIGTWDVIGMTNQPGAVLRSLDLPVRRIVFELNRNTIVTRGNGEVEDGIHRWRYSNIYMALVWFDRGPDEAAKRTSRLKFEGKRMYIQWPPPRDPRYPKESEGLLVLERVE